MTDLKHAFMGAEESGNDSNQRAASVVPHPIFQAVSMPRDPTRLSWGE